ncbi:MAG: right-handed parallel beta-helix repeat-containing protein, partial [Candidatus Promineifilaceae bacterium]
MNQTARPLTYTILLLALFLIVAVAVGQTTPVSQASSAATGEIVLVARDIIDLKWDPATYPAPGLQFARWELLRGPSAGSLSKIASGQSESTDHYRDSGLTAGATYHYRLDVVRCSAPCGPSDQIVYSFFSDSATTGVFQGAVHYSLELASGVYGIGFGGVGSSAAVSVVDGATLTAGAGVTLQPAAGVSSGGLKANGGRLEIAGATLKQISISFGDYYDPASSGAGWVNECLMQAGTYDVSIQLYGTSEAAVNENSGPFNVYADQQAGLTAKNNVMTGGIEVHGQATAVIEGNEITNGDLVVSGYGAQEDPRASAQIRDNIINLDYQTMGIHADYGASATVEDNTISYLGPVNSESSVVMDAVREGTILTAQRNLINNGKIAAFWGSEIQLADNVLLGDGSAIAVGCLFCLDGVQATGAIERNTLQAGWGLEMWTGSQELSIRHNCIRGNDPGLTVDARIATPLNVQYNWWGDASGPGHESNPGGSGDVIDGAKVVFAPWDTAGTYCRTTPPQSTKPDFQVVSVAMVQVVEGVNTLVEAKPLAVKAVVASDRLSDPDVKVSLVYNGKTFDTFYIVEDANVTKDLQLESASTTLNFRTLQQRTIVFFPDDVPFGSSVTARVEIDPADDVDESDEENNVKSSLQPIVKTYWGSDPGDQSLRILFYYNKGLYRAEIKNALTVARRGQS